MVIYNYFLAENDRLTKTRSLIKSRKHRSKILNMRNSLKFNVGDILLIIFWKESIVYRFEGICISIKNKSLMKPNTSLILRMLS